MMPHNVKLVEEFLSYAVTCGIVGCISAIAMGICLLVAWVAWFR